MLLGSVRLASIPTHKPVGAVADCDNRETGANERAGHAFVPAGPSLFHPDTLGRFSSSGSFAMLAAIHRASSLVSRLAADPAGRIAQPSTINKGEPFDTDSGYEFGRW